MAAHSSILAWRIPWTRAWRATVHGVAKSQTRLTNIGVGLFLWTLVGLFHYPIHYYDYYFGHTVRHVELLQPRDQGLNLCPLQWPHEF